VATLPDTNGQLVQNIVHFARALRKAGVKVGPAQVEDAIRAVEVAGFSQKLDFYFILRSTLINRPEHLDLYHQVFSMFWRDPEYLEHMIHLMSPTLRRPDEEAPKKKSAERRAAEALADTPEARAPEQAQEEIQVDAHLSWSETERLQAMDFEQMSVAEMAASERAIRGLTLPVPLLRTRRAMARPLGHVPDFRATLRNSFRRGGEFERIVRRAPRYRPPDLVALCDISGSMSVYSRVLLHFLHALAWTPGGNWGRVSAFTFGTQLTNVTRALQRRDIDAALSAIGQEARDWQGGTRIGEALERFNKDWSRRVLGQGAVVLLITDGLERDTTDRLAREAERLHKSCRRLLWLNPLLRWSEFTPQAGGVKAILPHVDGFHACHSLESLGDLTRVLNAKGPTAPMNFAA